MTRCNPCTAPAGRAATVAVAGGDGAVASAAGVALTGEPATGVALADVGAIGCCGFVAHEDADATDTGVAGTDVAGATAVGV